MIVPESIDRLVKAGWIENISTSNPSKPVIAWSKPERHGEASGQKKAIVFVRLYRELEGGKAISPEQLHQILILLEGLFRPQDGP